MTNIGVFDSGLGGLWILKYLEQELPGYNYIYFADQAHNTTNPADQQVA